MTVFIVLVLLVAISAFSLFGSRRNVLRSQANENDDKSDTEVGGQETIEDDRENKISALEDPQDEFSVYPFLIRISFPDVQHHKNESHRITSVYSPRQEKHYIVLRDALHVDENRLSELRVRLYDNLNSPQGPLLVCSCCNKPVLLKGRPGAKGEIVSISHFDDGLSYDGQSDDSWTPQDVENEEELVYLRNLFSAFAISFDSFAKEDSFLVVPGSDKRASGDILYACGNQRVAVIFATRSHPIDFILRRIRNAQNKGYIPIWVLGRGLINAHSLTVRDISVFSGGYVCTIDEAAIQKYYDTDIPVLIKVDSSTGKECFVRLDEFISDVSRNIAIIIGDCPARLRKGHSTTQSGYKKNRVHSSNGKDNKHQLPEISILEKPGDEGKNRPRHEYYDYWKGRRSHIKDDLYLERIGESYGILNLNTHRYLVLPIYDKILVSEDKSHVILVLKGVETEQSI